MTGLRAGSATDVGRVRTINQDQLLVAAPLFAVADGMGGHAAGEVASQTAVDALGAAFAGGPKTAQALAVAVQAANRAVWDTSEAHEEMRGMGTTLTGVALVPGDIGDVLAVVNVGDSRTYRLHEGVFEQVTVDHSLVAELVAEGRIGAAEAETHPQRHVLTRVLGVTPDVDVDLLTLEPHPGDRYVLCSDGLIREVTDEQVASVLRRLADPGEAARELVGMARAHGGSDNITVIVVDVVGDEEPALVGADDDATGKVALAAGAPSAPPLSRRARRKERRAAKAAERPRARLITVRVVAFFVLAIAILAGAFFATKSYARDAWYVGLRGDHVTIYQGHPGGILWWKPKVAATTKLTTKGMKAYNYPALRALHAGVIEPSLARAHIYVRNLELEKAALTPPTTPPPPTTTTPPTTTVHHKRPPRSTTTVPRHRRTTTSTTTRRTTRTTTRKAKR